MARNRNRTAETGRPGRAAEGDPRGGLLPAGGLLVAVLAVLVLAAILQTGEDTRLLTAGEMAGDVRREETRERSVAPASDPSVSVDDESGRTTVTSTSTDAPVAAGSEPIPGLPEDLERRAGADFRRLSGRRSDWTLQLMLACDPANVHGVLERTGAPSRLYVVPTDFGGRDCYRICWGLYGSRDEAVAGGLPPGLSDVEIGDPVPQPVSVVAP